MKYIKRFLELNPHTIRNYKVTKDKATIQTVFDEIITIKKVKKLYDVDIVTETKEIHNIQSYRLDGIDIFKLLYDCVFNIYRGLDIIYDFMEAKKEQGDDNV